jgi:lysophospholipase L1-like esterase
MRRQGAYASQLKNSNLFFAGYLNPVMTFKSCTGDVTTDVLKTQIPDVAATLPFANLITLSIGGNDIGFAKILKACIFHPLASCYNAISEARNLLYEGGLMTVTLP